MKNEPVSVICTDEEGVLCEHKLFVGKNNVKRAEKHFTKRIKELNSDLNKMDISDALDNGYYQYDGRCACIGEPEVMKGK